MSQNNRLENHVSSTKGVSLSERAAKHIKTQLGKHANSLGIRLSVDKTGCSGLAYVFDYVENINPNDKHFNVAEVAVYIDHGSYPYLKGLFIDFVKEGLNNKFTFTNPNQTGSCGCGESFTVNKTN
jgi:iron-sulfur cluster assembly protein